MIGASPMDESPVLMGNQKRNTLTLKVVTAGKTAKDGPARVMGKGQVQ